MGEHRRRQGITGRGEGGALGRGEGGAPAPAGEHLRARRRSTEQGRRRSTDGGEGGAPVPAGEHWQARRRSTTRGSTGAGGGALAREKEEHRAVRETQLEAGSGWHRRTTNLVVQS